MKGPVCLGPSFIEIVLVISGKVEKGAQSVPKTSHPLAYTLIRMTSRVSGDGLVGIIFTGKKAH